MGFDVMGTVSKFAGGLAGGIGEGIGKVAGKVADWVPSPQQYRRNKIRELTNQMFKIQNTKPFNGVLYDKLRTQRDKLEQEALSL